MLAIHLQQYNTQHTGNVFYFVHNHAILHCHALLTAAVVGLERTFYNVSEDDGVVEVCAIVYSPNFKCPINFAFNVKLSTSDGSAGIYTNLT